MTGRLRTLRQEGMRRYGFGPDAMKQLKLCPRCACAAPAAGRFCRVCGAKLPESTLYDAYKHQSRVCRVCDAVVPRSAQYCPKCGARLNETEE